MRLALIGAVESSAVTLRALVRLGHPPLAVITLPLEKAGRHSDFVDLRPAAAAAGVPLVEADQVNAPAVLDALRRLELDLLLVVGWSQLVRPELLRLPRRGCVGLHPAPLPELRGRAVIPWTILLGRRATGTTLFWIDEGTDSGDVLAQELFDVAPDETAATLVRKHLAALERMLDAVVPALAAGAEPRRPQDHARATWCAKRTAEDGLVDWSRGAREVWTLVRAAGDPYPGAFTLRRGRRLTLWSADWMPEGPWFGLEGQVQALDRDGAIVACGAGFVRLRTVQLEGEPRAPAQDVLKLHERLGLAWAAPRGEKAQP